MTEARRRRVLDRALLMPQEAEARAEGERKTAALHGAASEVGLDPELLRKAEEALLDEDRAEAARVREAEAAARRARTLRALGRVAVGAADAVSFDLGHWVNEAGAAGQVSVDNPRVE